MRIRVLEILRLQEGADSPQMFEDPGIRIKHIHAAKMLDFLQEPAGVVHGAEDLQAVVHAGHIIVVPVPRCRVDRAGACIQGHVVGKGEQRLPVDERVARLAAVQDTAGEPGDFARFPPADLFRNRLQEFGRNDVALAIRFHGGIFKIRMERDGQVRGQGPRRGRPDYDRPGSAAESGIDVGKVRSHRESDVNGWTGVVLVFDLGFG
jgi:hypothetical protein